MRQALIETPRAEPALLARLDELERTLAGLRRRLMGDPIRGRWNEASAPSILERIARVASGHWETRQAPTDTQKRSLEVARNQFDELHPELSTLLQTELPGLEVELEAAGAPWTPGRKLPVPRQ